MFRTRFLLYGIYRNMRKALEDARSMLSSLYAKSFFTCTKYIVTLHTAVVASYKVAVIRAKVDLHGQPCSLKSREADMIREGSYRLYKLRSCFSSSSAHAGVTEFESLNECGLLMFGPVQIDCDPVPMGRCSA